MSCLQTRVIYIFYRSNPLLFSLSLGNSVASTTQNPNWEYDLFFSSLTITLENTLCRCGNKISVLLHLVSDAHVYILVSNSNNKPTNDFRIDFGRQHDRLVALGEFLQSSLQIFLRSVIQELQKNLL